MTRRVFWEGSFLSLGFAVPLRTHQRGFYHTARICLVQGVGLAASPPSHGRILQSISGIIHVRREAYLIRDYGLPCGH